MEELAFQLKDSGAKAIITQLPFMDTARKAADMVGIPADRIAIIGDQKATDGSVKHFTSVRSTSGTSRYRRQKVKPAEDLAFLVYSSGTTGHPKGVMLTHRNIVSNIKQIKTGEYLDWKDVTPDGKGDKVLAFLPFFHIYGTCRMYSLAILRTANLVSAGLTCLIHQTIYTGYELVVMPKFEIEAFCRIVQEHKITFVYLVPPVVLLLSKHPCVEKYDLSSIRMCNSGAAPLTHELVKACYKKTGIKVKQGYGLSETSPTTHTQPWEDWETKVGSVGRLLPNMTTKYMSPEEKEVPVGEVGELWIKGPNIFKGYHNNIEGTKHALTEDGYFKTGDVGYQDKDGNFYITDRVKELIKYKGFQVPPAELEGLLAGHEKIDDVAVLGIYNKDEATEVPRAYVVVAKNVQPGPAVEKEIVEFVRSKVAAHKRLRGGVKFVDEIPKSASGKILRRVLKLKAQEEEKNPKAKL